MRTYTVSAEMPQACGGAKTVQAEGRTIVVEPACGRAGCADCACCDGGLDGEARCQQNTCPDCLFAAFVTRLADLQLKVGESTIA